MERKGKVIPCRSTKHGIAIQPYKHPPVAASKTCSLPGNVPSATAEGAAPPLALLGRWLAPHWVGYITTLESHQNRRPMLGPLVTEGSGARCAEKMRRHGTLGTGSVHREV